MDGQSRSIPWPPRVESLLDGNDIWEKIPLLFFVVNIPAAEHRIVGSVDSLHHAIIYTEELTRLLVA